MVLLVDAQAMPMLDSNASHGCADGYVQSFVAEGVYDWYDGTQIFTWTKDLLPGDTLRLAVFSYDGNVSNYSINTQVTAEK